MSRANWMLMGLGVGVGAMYFFDPNAGRRRRTVLMDKALATARKVECAAEIVSKDLSNRARGLVAEGQSYFKHENISDDVLCERIRAKLGRYVSYPRAIDVLVRDGHVKLAGMILSREVQPLLSRLKHMQGARHIENRLELFAPGEQPPHHLLGERSWMTALSSPSARFLIGAAGLAALVLGMGSRARSTFWLAALGGCMVEHAVRTGGLSRGGPQDFKKYPTEHPEHVRTASTEEALAHVTM